MTKEELMKYDFIVLIDKSGSMVTPDCPGGKSRWAYAQELTMALAAKCAEYDQDGATVGFFAKSVKLYSNITGAVEQVQKIFAENEPSGSTDTALAVKTVLDQYFASKAAGNVEAPAKPIILIVVTDGQPDSKEDLKKVIIDATLKMDADEEIGISFFQIGEDQNATKFLRELDDELVPQGAKFDIVDTKTTDELDNMTLTEALIAALED